MECDQEMPDARGVIPPMITLAAGLAGYARWFATSREMHQAAERAAERDAPSCPA